MAIDYDDFISDASSEKIVLAHLEPAQRLLVWTRLAPNTTTYKKSVGHYVITVEEEGTELTQVSSLAALTSASQWFFDKQNKILYVKTSGEVDPTEVFLVATYRLFFSNAPITLPHDLTATGDTVYYEPRIANASQFGSFLENDAQIGVALEGSGSIALNNNDDFFDQLYDKLFWENKSVSIYATGRNVKVGDQQKLYEGIIQAKAYSPFEVRFTLRDFITTLRDGVSLTLFSEADGAIPDDIIGKPKRRLYGRNAGVQLVSVSQVLDGFDLTGTLTLLLGSTTVTGTGTDFLEELTPNDTISFIDEFDNLIEFVIADVVDDTTAILTESPERGFANLTVSLRPQVPFRKRNRKWLIAEHPLRTPTTTVTAALQLNRIDVGDVTDIEEGDFVTVDVGGTEVTREIKRVTGLQLVFRQNLSGLPAIGAVVFKPAVQKVEYVVQREERFISRQLFNIRDFTVDNSGPNPFLILNELAEFNVTKARSVSGTVTFTNSSATVAGVGTKFNTEVRPRDFINTGQAAEYFEILKVVSDTELKLRIPYSLTSGDFTGTILKTMDIIDDKTSVIVDCFGKTTDNTPSGGLIRTGSDIVKDLLIEAGLSSKIDTARFAESDATANFLMGIKLPLDSLGGIPTRREVIDLVNQSIFGNLHKTKDFNIAFDVLAADKKPLIALRLKDDDIIDYKVNTKSQNIVKRTIINYRHQDASINSFDQITKVISKESTIATLLIKTERVQEKDVYLYKDQDALTMMQRWAFFNEISQSVLTMRAKPNLSNLEIGDVIFFNLDRLYTRFGTKDDENKIGIVSGISSNGTDLKVEVDDLGGWFFTVGQITPNDALPFSTAETIDRAFNGYITDNLSELVDNLDFSYRINLIG